jgi:hypothetical protein
MWIGHVEDEKENSSRANEDEYKSMIIKKRTNK